MPFSHRRRVGFLGIVAWTVLVAMSNLALAKDQKATEIQARHEFIAGRFRPALELYEKLYAESLHPVFLRNIARCHQKLENPDRAIEFFKAYLKKSPTVSIEERREIDEFIQEMEHLRKTRAANAKGLPVGETMPSATPAPAPAAAKPSNRLPLPTGEAAFPPSGGVGTVSGKGGTSPPDEPPLWRRGWFWGVVAGVAAVGIGSALLLRPRDGIRPQCPAPTVCM